VAAQRTEGATHLCYSDFVPPSSLLPHDRRKTSQITYSGCVFSDILGASVGSNRPKVIGGLFFFALGVARMSTIEPKVVLPSLEITPIDLRKHVEADKALAVLTMRKADDDAAAFNPARMQPDITGQPGAIGRYNSFKREQQRALEQIGRSPFFAKVEALRTDHDGSENVKLLVTKARDTGGIVCGDGWEVVSWTAPVTAVVLDKPFGSTGKFYVVSRKSRRPVLTTYEIGVSARYEEIVPRLKNASYAFGFGNVILTSEDDLAEMTWAMPDPVEARPAVYEAKPTFGLGDIIVLADQPQRAAMLLPFDQSVVIEGPPGSGKTSIGIMRIACLYDQQWAKLGLEKGKDAPFHDYESMSVLVYNEEMVDYLNSLKQSIGANVYVETTKDFFQRMCRGTKLLSGTQFVDKPTLAALKGRGEVLETFFAAFQQHAAEYRTHEVMALRESLFLIAPDFVSLAVAIEAWHARVARARCSGGSVSEGILLSDSLTQAAEDIRAGASPSRFCLDAAGQLPDTLRNGPSRLSEDRLREGLRSAKKHMEKYVRGVCERAAITKTMFKMPEYAALLDAAAADGILPRDVASGDRLWKKQYRIENPSYSEFDLAVFAWLSAKILLAGSSAEVPWIGAKRERLTHLAVDEAQDLSPCHISTLASLLTSGGTLTLVGDLHQNLNPLAGMRRWEDARVVGLNRCVFGVNYRQTNQLGSFLKELHRGLFDEEPGWSASPKLFGEIARAGTVRCYSDLARAVRHEALRWREHIPNATVAVLYDGRMKRKRMEWLRREIAQQLSGDLTSVDAVAEGSNSSSLRRTDRIIIASVRQTKGLEFDAVIFIETKRAWSKPLAEVDVRVRNGLYVAASRARAGLSLCMAGLPSCVTDIHAQGHCELVDWNNLKEAGDEE